MKRKVKKPDIEQAFVPVVVEFMERLNIPQDSSSVVVEFIRRIIQVINDEGYVIVPCDIFKENK